MAIHHTVALVADIDESLRFYCDGLGLDLLRDVRVEGDWPRLFGAPGRTVRAAFLGDRNAADEHAGVLELNSFDDYRPHTMPPEDLTAGLLMVSFVLDVESALERLAGLGLGGTPRQIVQQTPNGSITIVTVRDPDGTLVLLTPGSITQRA